MQAGGEGDNSVDSTDSHMSSNSSGTASGTASGTTRSSRSRNKHSNQNPQATEEEAPPVRETRRKAMLKERVCEIYDFYRVFLFIKYFVSLLLLTHSMFPKE